MGAADGRTSTSAERKRASRNFSQSTASGGDGRPIVGACAGNVRGRAATPSARVVGAVRRIPALVCPADEHRRSGAAGRFNAATVQLEASAAMASVTSHSGVFAYQFRARRIGAHHLREPGRHRRCVNGRRCGSTLPAATLHRAESAQADAGVHTSAGGSVGGRCFATELELHRGEPLEVTGPPAVLQLDDNDRSILWRRSPTRCQFPIHRVDVANGASLVSHWHPKTHARVQTGVISPPPPHHPAGSEIYPSFPTEKSSKPR
uniref:Uncharacterized protein n=1 Tax=Anopheles atroparvus TaxID=41427 RepID=A0AAG5DGT6_ANOAO